MNIRLLKIRRSLWRGDKSTLYRRLCRKRTKMCTKNTHRQARTGITTNVPVPQRPVRKIALGAGMMVNAGRLDPSSPRSSGAGPYLPVDKFRGLFERFRGPVHGFWGQMARNWPLTALGRNAGVKTNALGGIEGIDTNAMGIVLHLPHWHAIAIDCNWKFACFYLFFYLFRYRCLLTNLTQISFLIKRSSGSRYA